ncbi:MAG: hypothetical protein ACI4I6_05910 [Hominimerdicola sp.]
MIKYPNVARGLKILFISELVQIVGGLVSNVSSISIVGIVLKIIGLVAAAYGISGARKDSCSGFDTAFIVVTANAVANIILIFLSANSKIYSTITLVASILTLMVIYYIINSANILLLDIRDISNAGLGETVWKYTKVGLIVVVVSTFLTIISIVSLSPYMLLLCSIIMLVGTLICMAAQIMFIVYLYKSSASLNTPISTEDPFAQYYENQDNINSDRRF